MIGKKYLLYGEFWEGTHVDSIAKIFKQNEEIVRQKEEIDNLSSIVDNIFQESFCLNMEVGRYELTLDHLKDINPNAHKKFTYYLNNKIK